MLLSNQIQDLVNNFDFDNACASDIHKLYWTLENNRILALETKHEIEDNNPENVTAIKEAWAAYKESGYKAFGLRSGLHHNDGWTYEQIDQPWVANA